MCLAHEICSHKISAYILINGFFFIIYIQFFTYVTCFGYAKLLHKVSLIFIRGGCVLLFVFAIGFAL